METVTIHRYHYKEIIKAVKEKEDAGYEYVTRILPLEKDIEIRELQRQKINQLIKKTNFMYGGHYSGTGYICVMRKVN